MGRPQASKRDSRGALCGDRRLLGTEQRVRGGCHRPDHPRGEGGERAGGARRLLRAARPAVDPGRARSRTLVAVVACRPDRGGLRGAAAGDPAPQGGALGDGREDRPMWTAHGGQVNNSPRVTYDSRLTMRLLLVRRPVARTATNTGTLFVPTAWVSHGA